MSEKGRGTFVDACLGGTALLDDIDEWVREWHEAGGVIDGKDAPLPDYLGMTQDEYALWVEQSAALRFIVAAHQRRTDVDVLLTSAKDYALAARSEDPEATREVLMWLVETGQVDPEFASHA